MAAVTGHLQLGRGVLQLGVITTATRVAAVHSARNIITKQPDQLLSFPRGGRQILTPTQKHQPLFPAITQPLQSSMKSFQIQAQRY